MITSTDVCNDKGKSRPDLNTSRKLKRPSKKDKCQKPKRPKQKRFYQPYLSESSDARRIGGGLTNVQIENQQPEYFVDAQDDCDNGHIVSQSSSSDAAPIVRTQAHREQEGFNEECKPLVNFVLLGGSSQVLYDIYLGRTECKRLFFYYNGLHTLREILGFNSTRLNSNI